MPTRKQRRRELKAQRHDYEFVYVDGEGNELDEVPEELEQPKKERSNGSKPAAAKKGQPAQRGRRQPPQPSWSRAYTLLFVPFTFYIDRFAYRRWEARQGGGPSTTKKR
jgi:hypothetical protein